MTKRRRTDSTMTKRQKNRQHNDQKTEEQTAQWPKDRRTDSTMTKRQKDRQHNDQKKTDKGTNNELQNIAHKTKDWVTRTPLKAGSVLKYSRRVSSSCHTSCNRRVTLVANAFSIQVDWCVWSPYILYWYIYSSLLSVFVGKHLSLVRFICFASLVLCI